MYVVQRQTLRACMQSQNLCLTYSLVLRRQNTHCLEMEAGALRALHLLTATALCQMDQIDAASLPEQKGVPKLRPKESIVTR